MAETLITNLQPGKRYTVEVRGAPDGLWSLALPFTATTDQATTPTPTGLRAEGGLNTIFVEWEPIQLAALKHFEVHASQTPNFTISNATLRWIGNANETSFIVGPYETWYIKLLSVSKGGQVSAVSEEVSATSMGIEDIIDSVAPAAPTGVDLAFGLYTRQQILLGRSTLSWQPPADEDLAGYYVRYRVGSTSEWQSFAVDKSTTIYNFYTLARHDESGNLIQYSYQVASFDKSGNISEFVPQTPLTGYVPADNLQIPAVTMFSPRIMPGSIEWWWQESSALNLKDYVLEVSTSPTMSSPMRYYVGGNRFSMTADPALTYYARVRPRSVVDVEGFASNIQDSVADQIPATFIANIEAQQITAGTGLFATLTLQEGGGLVSPGISISRNGIELGNMSTGFTALPTGQLWTNGVDFNAALWRVDADGDMRVGGANKLNIDGPTGDLWIGNDVKANAPTQIYGDGRAVFNNVRINVTNLPVNTLTTFFEAGAFRVSKLANNTYEARLMGNMHIDAGGDIRIAGGDLTLLAGGEFDMGGGDFNMDGGRARLNGTHLTVGGSYITLQDEFGSYGAIRTNWNITAGSTSTPGMIIDRYGIRAYNASGVRTFEIHSENGTAYFSGTLNAATGSFTGDLSGAGGTFDGEVSGGIITGGLIQTSNANEGKVVIDGRGSAKDRITFYQLVGGSMTSSTLKQGLGGGLETSGSLRLGNDGNNNGDANLYVGVVEAMNNMYAEDGQTVLNESNHSHGSVPGQGIKEQISNITAGAQSELLGTYAGWATIGHQHPHNAFATAGHTHSSRTLKRDIEYVTIDALAEIMKFKPVRYRYIPDEERGLEDNPNWPKRFGVILEETTELIHDVQHWGNLDLIAYSVLNSRAIQQLKLEIDDLKKQLKAFRKGA